MDQRMNFVTLAVEDVERSRAFYVDALGWKPELFVPGEVLFLQVASGLVLSLWDRKAFAAEVGYEPATGSAPITLAHNVPDPTTVDAVLDDARKAGAAAVNAGEPREWGGYSGYFADPDGYRWEVAHNPGESGVRILAESLAWWREWRADPGTATDATPA
jgi:catechol 2,3-dioxygenase-like lactoylglutathione lyase family enzyme